MFKSSKKKTDDIDLKIQKPKIGHTREIKTHLREKSDLEKIFFGFKHNLKRKTVYKMILSLPQDILDKNIYIITSNLLEGFLQDRNIEKMFYTVLSRIVKSKKAFSIKNLCFDYLIAQLNLDRDYKDFAQFLVRQFKDVFVARRDDILPFLDDCDLKNTIINLKDNCSIVKDVIILPVTYITD